MVKLFRFWTRRLEQTHEEAVRYWTEQYAPRMVGSFGNDLAGYVTNIGLPTNWGGEERVEAPPWDGVDEIWLGVAPEDIKEAFARADGTLGPAEEEFLGNSQWMLVDEVIQRDGTGRGFEFKLLEPLVRRRDRTWEEFVDFWLNQHAPLVRRTWDTTIARYMTNLGLANPFNWRLPEEGPPYDGVAEFYFGCTLEEYRHSLAETADILVPDEAGLVSSWRAVLVQEIVQKDVNR